MFKENYVIFDGKCVYKTHGFNDFFNFLLNFYPKLLFYLLTY